MRLSYPFPTGLCVVFFVALVASLTLAVASVAYADGPDGTGPGGVGSTDGSSSLVLWLRGDAGVHTSGGAVIRWSDQSGNDNSASGVGATYVSDRINGQPALRFDGSDVYSVSGLDIANPYTIFTVSRQDGSTRRRLISSGSVNWLLGYHEGQEDQFYAEGWIHRPATPVTSEPIMYSATGDGTSCALYRDGQQLARNDGGTAAAGILQLGGTTAEASDGTVAEVIVFDTVVNTVQRILVENYLSAKYDVPLSAGDRYAGDTSDSGGYDLDVVGIGQESDGSHVQARGAGLVLKGSSFLVDDGDYVLAGHRTPRSGVSSADLPDGVSQRWARVWYVDRTDGGSSTNGNLTLAFDFSEGRVGGTPVNAGNYRLLFCSGESGPLSAVTVVSTSVVDDQVVFEVSDPDVQDGYYTLGTIDVSSSPLSGTQLTLSKAVDDAYPIPGQRITYVVAVENSGLSTATGVVVSDTLPGGLTFAGPVTLEGSSGAVARRASDLPTLASGLTVAAGGRVTITLPVTVNVGLVNDRIITNTAAVSCAEMTALQQGSERVRVTEVVGVVFINEILAANTSTNRDPDYVFSDWIELYNSGSRPIDLGGLYLTDDLADPTKWRIPDGAVVEPGGFKLFWADGTDRTDEANGVYHTKFRLGQAGEEVGLFGPAGILVDSLVYEPQISDVSLGRKPDAGPAWYFFAEPTPGRVNDTDGCQEPVTAPPPEFSLPGGMYSGTQAIALSVSAPSTAASVTIRYTLDGSTPTQASAAYTSPIDLRATTVVRARAFATNCLPSATIGHTYFIDEAHSLPVVSISTDPDNLWDLETGIYARYWVDLENRVSLEYYEADGDLGFSLDAGARIFGGHARNMPQKALAILARNKYGAGEIDYPIFDDKPLDSIKTFVLRNSGNDWRSTMLRDALTPALIKDRMDVDYLAYRPAIVYLNGEYWGIHNIREKINEHYIASNYGIDPAKVDLLHTSVRYAEGHVALAGDVEHYDNLMDFIESHDMALPQSLEYVQTQIDLEEYLDYLIAEMTIANSDWLLNNSRYWRPRTEDGRWRWIVYDTDVAFGLDVSIYDWGHRDHAYDMIEYATRDQPESLLIRRLLENAEFRNEFIQRFASHLNTTFLPERVIGIIDRLKADIEPEMPGHIARWKDHCGGHEHLECGIQSMDAWEADVNLMRDFAVQRPDHIRQHIIDKFGLKGTVTLTVTVSGSGAGKVLINGVALPEGGFTGIYFRDVPLRLTAVPSAGCRFAGWQGTPGSAAHSIAITPTEALAITATFEMGSPGVSTSETEMQDGARWRSRDTEVGSIVINEIHYNPFSPQDSGDEYEFIELCNVGKAPVDLSGYAFAEGVEFTFPRGSTVSAGEYILIARSADAYRGQGVQVFQWANGGLRNSGEGIRLVDAAGREVDTVTYGAGGGEGDSALWPGEPDGDGPSLALIEPSRDNSLPESWRASTIVGGTPGQPNLESRAISTSGIRYRSSRSHTDDSLFGIPEGRRFATMPYDRVYLRLVMRSFP